MARTSTTSGEGGAPSVGSVDGTIDGSNMTFTVPESTAALVFYNGLLLKSPNDYAISGTTLTMTYAPEVGSIFQFYYWT